METLPHIDESRDSALRGQNAQPAAQKPLDLRQLHKYLAGFIKADCGADKMAHDAATFIARLTNAQFVVYFAADKAGTLSAAAEHRVAVSEEIGKYWLEMLAEQSAKACSEKMLQVARLQQNRIAMAVPVERFGAQPEALAAVFLLGAERAESFVAILQLVAGVLTAYHLQSVNQANEWELETACAMLELIVSVGKSEDVRDAGVLLVNSVKNYLGCERVAVGLKSRRGTSCKVLAISGMSDLNLQAELPQAVQAAMVESVRGGDWLVWPPEKDQSQALLPAHSRLSGICDNAKICSAPLRQADGEVIGGWIFWGMESPDLRVKAERFAMVSASPVGSSLLLLKHGQMNPVRRLIRKWKLFERKAFWISAAVVLLLGVSFWPYRIGCECSIEPVKKRFVVAPFAGVFEKSLVRPGDVVKADQKLAQMDGRELRMELAGVVADYQRAKKSRDVNVAAGKTGASQIDALEMQGLDQKRQLLEKRIDNLDIKTPVAGIVVSGDLERTEGSPVTSGQALYEIAPLDKMIVEVEIQDEDIAHVEAGQKVSVKLEAFPGTIWKGTIDRIHPRSEIRDSKNLFIAEVSIDEEGQTLRPGMKGTATVTTASHSLLWISLHKAWYACWKWLGM